MSSPTSNPRLRLVPIVLAQAIGLACGLASLRLNSHLVPPEVLGVYGLFLTLTPVGMWLVYVGVLKYVIRNWAAAPARPELCRALIAVWLRRIPWLALLAAIPAVVLTQLDLRDRLLLWATLLASAALLTIAAMVQTALQADRAHWRDCATSAVGSTTRSFLPPLVYVATGSVTALWLGFTAHAFVFALTGLAVLRARVTAPHSTRPTAATPPWGIYEGPLFTVLAVANLIVLGLNRWLVAWFFGEHEAGYFTLAGSAVMIVTSMLATVLIQYAQPGWFALGDAAVADQRALARRVDLVALAYTAVGLAGVAVLSALAPRLIGPLISASYREALHWFFPCGCFGLAVSLGQFYHTMLLAGRRERSCGPVDLVTAGIVIGGCLLAAYAGKNWLAHWLVVTPLVPWLLTRPLARHFLLKPALDPAPAPAR